MKDRVFIFDTTLRDGEQSPGCSMTVDEKLRMAHKLSELNVDIMEVGFPIASAGDFEAVKKVAEALPSVRVAALARCCRADIELAARALASARMPRIHTFIATSDIHLEHKLRKSRQQVLDETVDAVELALSFVEDVEWSAEDATRTDPVYLEEICKAAVAAGATTINLPDTVGYSFPSEYSALIRRLVDALDEKIVISTHCHDDLGLASANTLAGVEAGARQIECTVNGIGERAGNCALEEVVMAMVVRGDSFPFETEIVSQQLYPSSQLLAQLISFHPQPNKAIVGANAFAHEAGIHQDGFFKERTTYEIMEPLSVGVPESSVILGKHSGRHALSRRCSDLGYALDPSQLEDLYHRFIDLAEDRKQGVADTEVETLIRKVMMPEASGI